MLYLVSGAVASGKTTLANAVAAAVPDLVVMEEGRRVARTGAGRLEYLEEFVADFLALEAQGKDVIFPAQTWGEWTGGTYIQSERRVYVCDGVGVARDDKGEVLLEAYRAAAGHPDAGWREDAGLMIPKEMR